MLKSWRIKQDVLGEAPSALLNTSWLQRCLSALTGPHSLISLFHRGEDLHLISSASSLDCELSSVYCSVCCYTPTLEHGRWLINVFKICCMGHLCVISEQRFMCIILCTRFSKPI